LLELDYITLYYALHNSTFKHYAAALWLICYLRGTINLGISYSLDGSYVLTGYVDANYATQNLDIVTTVIFYIVGSIC
jgi:hypothetical protein